ncbi:MAG: NAD-dependent epimerase/dehydratase family protein [Treponemataceae bacterium]
MLKVLLTGSSGFIGKNIIPFLRGRYDIEYYSRQDLDLLKFSEVEKLFSKRKYDVVLHFANPNYVKNKLDKQCTQFEDSIRMFQNLFFFRQQYKKMIYLGSGAEYDKTKNIDCVNEEECFRYVPHDSYGLAKFTINQIASKSKNVYNLCVFGCFGPFDYHTKFITHCIRSVLLDKDITIRKDCLFDYIHVYDLAKMVIWLIDNDVKFHMYNAGGGEHLKLSEIACIVLKKMQSRKGIKILEAGMGNSYTASNSRIITESGISLHPIEYGIEKQIQWEKENWTCDTVFDGE